MAESFTKDALDAVQAVVQPPPRRTHKLGWCTTAETSAAFTTAWDAREDARRSMRASPRDTTTWTMLKTACANLRGVINAGLHACVEYIAETETLLADNDQRGFDKYLTDTVELVDRMARSEQFIMSEDRTRLEDNLSIRERWGGGIPSDPSEQEIALT